MTDATIQVSGPAADEAAQSLRNRLEAELDGDDQVAPVEVNRSAELVIASIGLAFSGIQAAKTLWDWWAERRGDEGLRVRILLDDGEQVDLSGVDREQFELILDRRSKGSS